MNEYLIQGETLTELGDKIRVLSGTEDSMTPIQMTSNVQSANDEVDAQSALIDQLSAALEGKAGGGNTDIEDALVSRMLTEYSNDSVTSIGNYAFYYYTKLATIDFPVVTSIGTYAFRGCTSLTTANFPNVTSISGGAFYGCSALTTVDFPNVTNISGTYAFRDCTSLTTANFPNVTDATSYNFENCNALTTVDFSVVTKIGFGTFDNCYSLTSLILRSTTMATLSNTNAFSGCYHILGTVDSTYNPNGDKDGYIYVPRNLIEDYKTATNWSTYADQFRALEDYTVDGTIIGELDFDKLDSNQSDIPSFTIDDMVYYTDGSLNWDEWIESEYNTDDFYIDGKYGPLLIISSSGGTIRSLMRLEGEDHISYDVEPEDFVQPGGTYTWYILGLGQE